MIETTPLAAPLVLRSGVVLKNRLAKAAMSDSLGDGRGNPTDEQVRLYERWSEGGAALSLIGEVQIDPRFPEKPGNLVLGEQADFAGLGRLAAAGAEHAGHVWPQLGHAGALAPAPIAEPAGPSPLDLDGLRCRGLTIAEVEQLPSVYAAAAGRARRAGFTGVEIHAGHGFLLSQFLSPLFNRRTDRYGGSIEARSQVVVDVARAVRREVGADVAIAIKLNATDQLEGGLDEDDALVVVERVGDIVDLIDISGGTYFPGAPSSSDRVSSGPYFLRFAQAARRVTDAALMLTGGFKHRDEAVDAVASGAVDVVGLARAMAIAPDLPATWLRSDGADPRFPRFESPPPGGMTAWYTMRLVALAEDRETTFDLGLVEAIAAYDARDGAKEALWRARFGGA